MDLQLTYTVIILLIFLLNYTEQYQLLENPETITKYGRVIGTREQSMKGRIFHAYRGIPYAKPPIGNLRFKVFT